MADDAVPMVGVVVVNYLRTDLTRRCLESLEHLTWPGDRLAVALVDNGSAPSELDEIRDRFPAVRVADSGGNVGFGGACNRGFAMLDDCTYLALLNNDAIPDPAWLEPLVHVLDSDPQVGAAVPKILLSGRFISVELSSPAERPGRGDGRELGVQLCGARIDGSDVSSRVHLVSGFWGWETDAVTIGGSFAWSDGHGVARLPADRATAPTSVELRLACGRGPTMATVAVGGSSTEALVPIHPEWVRLPVGELDDVVNSAGTILLADGAIADRGYLEVDDPSFDTPAEVFGWSGAAVLLRRRYLDEVGHFDEPFFLYYEDADLAWRGRLRGWRYTYEPRSVVRHDHSATVGDRSLLATHVAARNRLVMLTKCAPAAMARAAVAAELGQLFDAVLRDLILKPLSLRAPVFRHVVARARVLAGFTAMLPHALRGRRRARSAAGTAALDTELSRWLRGAPGALH